LANAPADDSHRSRLGGVALLAFAGEGDRAVGSRVLHAAAVALSLAAFFTRHARQRASSRCDQVQPRAMRWAGVMRPAHRLMQESESRTLGPSARKGSG